MESKSITWYSTFNSEAGYPDRKVVGSLFELEPDQCLGELSEQEWTEYGTLVNRLETACRSGLGATLFTGRFHHK